MWTLRLKIYNKENFLNQLAKKYNLLIEGYPLNSFTKDGKFYVSVAGKVFGEEKSKKAFFRELKKVKQIKNLEVKEDFGIMTAEQPIQIAKLYAGFFLYLEPIKVTKDFYQIYYIGSWDRKSLAQLINLKVPNVEIKVLSFKQEKIKDISIVSISPELTKKQENAFEFAYKTGYYNFPRNSELGKLAKLMKVSISTYQAHLRKAEKKIMDFFYKYTG